MTAFQLFHQTFVQTFFGLNTKINLCFAYTVAIEECLFSYPRIQNEHPKTAHSTLSAAAAKP